jgi:lysophospholipase L1-like esterase
VQHLPLTTVVHRLGEGFGVSHWDARGIRLSRYSCTRCPDILVIGDSYTEALQVNDDQAYVAVAESLLVGPKPIRLLNAGDASASPADYVVRAARYRKQIRPAWVVVQLNADDLGRDAFLPDKVHFRQNGESLSLVVPAPYSYGRITKTLNFIRERSALANYAISRLDIARQGPKGPPWFRAGFEPRMPATASAPPQTFPLERELSLLRAAYGNRITFLFLPLFNKPVENEETRFDRYCRMTQTSCVNFRASFEEFQRSGTAPYGFPNSRFAFGHLNPAGHAAAARLLANELRRLQQHGLF